MGDIDDKGYSPVISLNSPCITVKKTFHKGSIPNMLTEPDFVKLWKIGKNQMDYLITIIQITSTFIKDRDGRNS